MPVIGTAGHVDHGKSTLVAALTGRDPDRWAEEKERGLTIDLGFAWARLPDGPEVSFVDVPGHERFMKNMLAGIEAIDVALFVVAADEGWMPQSEEHLAVLDLLEVERGVIALTKVDRVDSDLVELATLEVSERLEGTRLADAAVIGVSALEGRGLDQLTEELSRLVAKVPVGADGEPRMWIDRSFVIEGAGTVVTGTLLDGSLSVGDQVAIWPGDHRARIRSIQSHETALEQAPPRRRVALNLSGLDRARLARGAMLGRPGSWHATSRIAVQVRPARFVDELTNRGAYHLHIGSGAWPVRLRMVSADVAILDLPEPLAITMGDRFVIRDTGRRLVVGGGRVLDPDPGRPNTLTATIDGVSAADLLLRTLDLGPDERATALLAVRGSAPVDRLAAASGGGTPRDAVVAGGTAHTVDHADVIGEQLTAAAARYHDLHPLRPGLPLAEALPASGIQLDELAALAERRKDLAIESGLVRLRSFRGARTDSQTETWTRAKKLLEESGHTQVPRAADLDLDPDLLHSLIRDGSLVRISAEFVYLPDQVATLTDIIRTFDEPFTVSEFKDRAGLSRKYAVPVLEWSDATGLTVRMGDRRRVRG